jgi:hypothetical protein
MALWTRSMQIGTARERVAGSFSAAPPLSKMSHGRIVQRHFRWETPYAPTGRTQPHAKFGLLAGDQVVPESANRLDRLHPHHYISATRPHLPYWPIPFPIAQPIVDRSRWLPLATASAHCSNNRMCLEEAERFTRPTLVEHAITVYELHTAKIGRLPAQKSEPRISRACCGERQAHF